MPATLAEFFVLAAAVCLLYRLLEPLRRRIERLLLILIDPSKTDIIDAQVVPQHRKPRKE